MDTRQRRLSILMLPWLAHGHISPFLELAKKLTERNCYIYFCSTPVNLNSLGEKISKQDSVSIQLVELHLPSMPELPPHYHTTKGLPPHLMPTLKEAFDMASPSFSHILKTLKPDLVIYDIIQPWAPSLASLQNIPAVNFVCSSAVLTSFVVHAANKPGEEFPIPAVRLQDYIQIWLTYAIEPTANGIKDVDRFLQCYGRSSDIILVKTFSELEQKYLDYASVLLKKKMVPVGPLVQDPVNEDGKPEIIEWLEKKEPSSTVFVSFGSEYFLSEKDREEIAHGLELSDVNFIWVVRFPLGEKIELEEALPEGFLEKIGERGMMIEGWAPQTMILGHPSTGGFVSHCGWSSVMESMKFGIPIIAMPMQLDQPLNARLVEDVGVGFEVKRNKDERFERKDIAKVIRKVVLEKTGEGVRKKARELGEIINEKGKKEMDRVLDDLFQLLE